MNKLTIKNYEKHKNFATELVAKMTLEEKISQLCSLSPAIKRLNIPPYHWWNEGLHGVARAGTATVFPQAIGLAATFSDDVLKTVGEITALEGRIKYNCAVLENDRSIYKGITFWSPNINIYRDPRWGRGHETYGEDPTLTAQCATNYVNGVQTENSDGYEEASACLKHFAAHSGPEGCRHGFDSVVSDFDLYDTYLSAFETCVKETNVSGIMGAYNMINGIHSCGNIPLMQTLLRDEWGFLGYYVSDCGALADMHQFCLITHTAVESATLALKAGCDLNCGQVYLSVLQAYNEGKVTEEEIDRSVIRLFIIRARLGLFDENCDYNKLTDYKTVECQKHLDYAYDAAVKSVVMLKNNGILPLNESYKTIAVIGPTAENIRALEGNYNGTATSYINIVDGIKNRAPKDTRIIYAQGCHLYRDVIESCSDKCDGFTNAISAAKASDVIFLCLGLDPSIEGEQGDANNEYGAGDKLSLSFPGLQLKLFEELKKLNKPIVLVVLAGGSLDLNYASNNADAILYGWYPGVQGGNAIADIAFGNKNPSGKTPVTFYRSLDDIPEFEDYSMKGRTYRYLEKEPLYPFGFGLSYSKLSYRAPIINKLENGDFTATVYAKNLSDIPVNAVIELYSTYSKEKFITPNCKLIGYSRINLDSNEENSIDIFVSREKIMLTDENGKRYMPQNTVMIHAGGGQPNEQTAKLSDENCASAIY